MNGERTYRPPLELQSLTRRFGKQIVCTACPGLADQQTAPKDEPFIPVKQRRGLRPRAAEALVAWRIGPIQDDVSKDYGLLNKAAEHEFNDDGVQVGDAFLRAFGIQ